MQVYKGLDIGTAKVTREEMQGVPHHLVDFLPPEQPFSVADFVQRAGQCIEDICGRGRMPILTGGTGLYLSSLLDGVRFAPQKVSEHLREQLRSEAQLLGTQAMHDRLARIDPQAAAAIHPNNLNRVLRALEAYYTCGETISSQQASSRPLQRPYDAFVFCLFYPERAILYERIDRRVERMMQQGLLEEAREVWKKRTRFCTAAQAIGYKEFFPYFEGKQTLEACVADLKQASRRYAKRQLTWFRHMDEVHWLDAGVPDVTQQALEALRAVCFCV